MKDKAVHYQERLREFHDCLRSYPKDTFWRQEFHFEALEDWSIYHDLKSLSDWFLSQREQCGMSVEEIPLNRCQSWQVDSLTGNYAHSSGEFFTVHGIRVSQGMTREKASWDQPILTQVGFDGGILGIARQRHRGIPHYLLEAKAEPGNVGLVQLSPTLQATFSNLKRAHEGRKPHFAEYFESPEVHGATVLNRAWLAEDGGRLFRKRNQGMLVELEEGLELEPPANFVWVSLYQIKELVKEDAWVNPHVRGILAHI